MRLIFSGIILLLLQSSHAWSQSKLMTLDEAIATGLNKNFSILISRNNNEINRSKYDFGTTSSFKSYGPVTGLNLSYSLFDGFNKSRNSANALIQRESSRFELQQVTKDIESQVFQLYNEYENNLKLVKFEADNLIISKRNTFIAFEKYRLGELSDIDLRQIQIMQLQAENSLLLAQFQAKQIETELLRISGKILPAN